MVIFMKKRSQPSERPARCGWCRHGASSADGTRVFCKKRGVMDADDCCSRYDYDPLRRVPHAQPVLPVPDAEEFRLS